MLCDPGWIVNLIGARELRQYWHTEKRRPPTDYFVLFEGRHALIDMEPEVFALQLPHSKVRAYDPKIYLRSTKLQPPDEVGSLVVVPGKKKSCVGRCSC